MKRTLTGLLLAALASTAFAAIEITSRDFTCVPVSVHQVLSVAASLP